MSWTKEQRKEYMKAYYQAHKEDRKAYYEANKEEHNKKMKAWQEEHREAYKAYQKAYQKAHKEENKAYQKAYQKAYKKADVNSLGETKNSIRQKSLRYLKKHGIKIKGYEIHHCFGYDDPSKFIHCSKEMHLQIHQFLRDNNIDAD